MGLVIERKANESVVMTLPDGRDIVVTFRKVSERRVSLNIEADQDIIISRGERTQRTVDDRLKEVIGQS